MCVPQVSRIVNDILDGKFTGSFICPYLLVNRICPGDKTKGAPVAACDDAPAPPTDATKVDVRPIKIREALLRLVSTVAIALTAKPHYAELFPTVAQVGCGTPGGIERAVHVLRAALDAGGDTSVLISIDYTNAYNTRSRSRMHHAIVSNPHTERLQRLFRFIYGTECESIFYEHGSVTSREGSEQGCAIGGFAFAHSMTPAFTNAAKDLVCSAVGCADDWSVAGNWLACIDAVKRLLADKSIDEMKVNAPKCWVLWPHAHDPPAALTASVAALGFQLRRGHAVKLGACFATDPHLISAWALKQVEKHTALFDFITHDKMDAQTGFHLLRSSLLPRMQFLSRCHAPAHIMEALKAWDDKVYACFLTLHNMTITSSGSTVSEREIVRKQVALPATGFGGLDHCSQRTDQERPLRVRADRRATSRPTRQHNSLHTCPHRVKHTPIPGHGVGTRPALMRIIYKP